jgi:hypothetical protein
MRLSEFMRLDAEQKKLTVLHQGVLIGKRDTAHCKVFLFQLGYYYVETHCNRSNKQVEEFRVFDDTDDLSPYLHSISIDDLLN